MKILIIQDYLRSGGTERHSVFLAGSFADAGHDVSLVTFRPGGQLATESWQPNFAYHSLQKRDWHLDWFAPGLRGLVSKIFPDIVLCMGRMANCYAGLIQSRLPGTSVFCTMRTGKPLPYLFLRSLKLCRHIIANSFVAKRVLAQVYHVPEVKITVVHNPLLRFTESPPERNDELRRTHGAGPKTVVLLNVAMFRPEKNQRELIEICSRLPGYLDWQLWLAGEGPARAACEKLAGDLGLGSRVKFVGYLPDPTPLYRGADLAVLTSQSESLSNFLIEAQLHGLPAIAYDIVGVGECFIPDQSGYLVANRDRTAFVDQLIALLRDPALRGRFAATACDYARRNFLPQRQVQAHLTLFAKYGPPKPSAAARN